MSDPSGQEPTARPPARITARKTAAAGARLAMGRGGRLLHLLAQLALLIVLLSGICIGALAFRLSQGPWDLTWLVRRISQNTDSHVAMGRVELAWQGLHGGIDRPLAIVLSDVILTNTGNQKLATIPRAELSLGVASLLRGKIAVRAIRLNGAILTLVRGEDGKLSLGGDNSGGGSPAISPETSYTLRRAQLTDCMVSLEDRKLGVTWQASQINADISRATADASGVASATISAGGQTARLDAKLTMPVTGGVNADVTASPLNPSHLASISPDFAPLAAMDAMLTLSASVALDAAFAPIHATLSADAGPGALHIGPGIMPIRAAALTADATPSTLDLKLTQLRLQARDAAPPTTITAHVQASRADGKIAAQIGVDIDQVAFADLPALWPEGVGGPGTRPWITKNITAGNAHNGHVTLTLTAPEDFSDATVTKIAGGIEGNDVTTWWLRPVPPIEHGTAHVVFVDPDTLDVLVDNGTQQGSKLTLKPSKVRLTGIAGHDQFVAIQANLGGPLPDLLTLLSNKKIHLLDRRPIPMHDPVGDVTGLLTVSLPLKNNLDIDQVAIRAVGKLAGGHLGGIAAGRDLDQANLDFDVGNDGLKIAGNGIIATIPAKLKIDMDFRSGPPSQVLEHIVVMADATAKQITNAGLDSGGRISGSMGAALDYTTRRDNSADVQVTADLTRTGIVLRPTNWTKAEGTAGRAEAHVRLDHDHITQIDRVSATAPGLLIQASTDMAGGKPGLLHIQRAMIGDGTDLAGDLRIPAQQGQPYIATITGPKLDLSWMFAHSAPQPKSPKPEPRGPAYQLQAKLGHVLMAGDRIFDNVVADVASDGLITTLADVTAQAGGKLSLSIAHRGTGRSLRAQADDAGTMLRAFDVVDELTGGKLTVTGTFDDSNATHQLRGRAEIVDFRMVHAPMVARLLQAMSLYGLMEVAQGPGLGFTRLVAPFGYGGDALVLEDARAYSPSLGVTVKGRIDLTTRTLDLQGTVIPAYFFNSLLGRVPLVGRIFSPEEGGGLFAAAYSVQGAADDPKVSVNPLSALTPGFLRGFFDIFDSPAKQP